MAYGLVDPPPSGRVGWAQVDRGFVAQVADVMGGRTARMNAEQRAEAQKRIVGEFSAVKHVRGILSMGRSGGASAAAAAAVAFSAAAAGREGAGGLWAKRGWGGSGH